MSKPIKNIYFNIYNSNIFFGHFCNSYKYLTDFFFVLFERENNPDNLFYYYFCNQYFVFDYQIKI